MTLIVQHNGVLQFTADRLQMADSKTDTAAASPITYNFLDDAPPPPPQGRLTHANVKYISHVISTALNVDVTLFKDLAGRQNAADPILDYPHFSSTFELSIPANNYLAMQLTPNGAGSTHMIKCPVYGSGEPMEFSLSHNPGDFNPLSCIAYKTNVHYDDTPIFYYRNFLPDTAFYHYVANGQPVYINARPMTGHATLLRIASQ